MMIICTTDETYLQAHLQSTPFAGHASVFLRLGNAAFHDLQAYYSRSQIVECHDFGGEAVNDGPDVNAATHDDENAFRWIG